MNFSDLQERVWTRLGVIQTTQRFNYQLQMIKDNINFSYDLIVRELPLPMRLKREDTISLVVGTTIYTLNDWVDYLIDMWTEDVNGHKIDPKPSGDSYRDGSRRSNATPIVGFPEISWYEDTDTAEKSGTAATVAKDAKAVTGLSGLVDGDAGKILQLNGEGMLHNVDSQTAGTQANIDRGFVERVKGESTAGPDGGPTTVKWELSPPGRRRLVVRPGLNDTLTVFYTYSRIAQPLMLDSDEPQLDRNWHDLILDKAIAKTLRDSADPVDQSQQYEVSFENDLERMKAMDYRTVNLPNRMRYRKPGTFRPRTSVDADPGRR